MSEVLPPTAELPTVPSRGGSRTAIWLGSAQPARSVRWLDGALRAAAGFDHAIAIAAGDAPWLDLAADRARRAGLACAGFATDLQLDYLGWAQIAVAAARQLGATTVLVDEASRPERFPEVAAIAELLDAVQLTHVVRLASDGRAIHATRVAGRQLQTVRVRGPAVIGVRIAGAPVDEAPAPLPSPMHRLDLDILGADPAALAHRALPPRAGAGPRTTAERIAERVALHLVPRTPPRVK